MNKKDYRLAMVEWVDAEEYGSVGWNDIKEVLAYAKKPCPQMRSVGWVVHEDDDHIALLSTLGTKECSTLEKIPKAFLCKVTPLEECQTKPTKKGLK